MTISAFLVFAAGLVGILCTGAPVAAAIWLYRSKKAAAGSFFWGAAAYMLFVLVLGGTCGDLLSLLEFTSALWFRVLYAGFSAALFTVLGLWCCCSLMLRESRTLEDALMAGVGFGWVDAFIMVGVEMLYTAALGAALRRDPEVFAADPNAEMYADMAAQLAAMDPWEVLAVGVSHLVTVTMVTGLAVLMMTAVARRTAGGVLLGTVLHFTSSALSAWLSGVWLSLVLQILFAAAVCLLAHSAVRTHWQAQGPDSSVPGTAGSGVTTIKVNDRLPRRPL